MDIDDFDIEQCDRMWQSVADHEAAHCIVAAVAGFYVANVRVRPTVRNPGVARIRGMYLGAWDADFFTPRDDQTGKRVLRKESIDLCMADVLCKNNGWSVDEMKRLIRAEFCVSLAGHAIDGDAFFDENEAYPDGTDFDHAGMYLQWLRHFGDHRPVEYFMDDLVFDALGSFEEHFERLSDALRLKSHIGRRELKKMLPKPWAGWPS